MLRTLTASALLALVLANPPAAFAQGGDAQGAGGQLTGTVGGPGPGPDRKLPPKDAIAPVASQAIETPFVGTFAVSGGARGTLTVSRQGDVLTFEGFADGDFCIVPRVSEPGPWRIPVGAARQGFVDRLRLDGQAPAEKTPDPVLVVTHDGKGGLTGVLEKGDRKTPVTLTREKLALVLWGTHESGMKVYGQQCSAYYRAKGYKVTEGPGEWAGGVKTLLQAEEYGHTFQRIVIVCHGGWDGPGFEVEGAWMWQLSATEDPESFGNLVRAIRRGTTRDAKLIYSACHSGGSNRYETDGPTYRYTDDVARQTGRAAYGVNGSTSTEWSVQLCRFAEGEGPAKQESRVSGPGGGKTVMGGRAAGPLPIANRSLGGDE